MTDKIENTNTKVATTSDLSEWVGPNTTTPDVNQHIARNMRDLVESDHLDWTDRLFAFDEIKGFPDGIPIGPTQTTNTGMYDILDLIREYTLLGFPLTKYAALSYDSLEIRITVSDPKNLVGGMFFGWWPYIDWYDKNPEETFNVITAEEFLRNSFFNGPYTHFLPFGMSEDIAFTIPWTFKSPLLTTQLVQNLNSASPSNRPCYGTPCVWWAMADGSNYVTSVTNPAALRIFAKFNNLRFYGPSNEATEFVLQNQSGLEAVAGAEVVTAIASTLGADALVSKFTDMFVPGEEATELAETGTYDDPQSVQLAYFGDTTSCSYPTTTPIFSPHLNMQSVPTPSVHEMLSRPQFIGVFDSSITDFTVFTNDPMRFRTFDGTPGNCANTYFRFIGMLNRYWRGTLNFHFIIAGHPLIQVQFNAFVSYSNSNALASNLGAEFARHLTTFPGSKHIVIPCPYLTMADYMPVYDAYPFDAPPAISHNARINARLRVVSTMLDLAPTIPCYVFVSAGSDFKFYSPIPPGLYNPDEITPTPVSDGLDKIFTFIPLKGTKDPPKEPLLEDQVFLPMTDQIETARSRFMITSDPGTHVSLPTVYDYMKLWSRSVPFLDYDNDDDEEPTPDASVGFTSATWYPPIDRSEDMDANNSWYFTLDYIAYFSSLFALYKGEMGFKLCVSSDEARPQNGYVYVSLGDPVTRQKTHIPFGYTDEQVPPESNFGAGTVITPQSKQPVLDFTLPYRGSNVWSWTIINAYTRGSIPDFGIIPNASVNHNIVLISDSDVLLDAMFRKIGPNFALAVEAGLPPPTMWAARGFDWSV